MAYINAFEGEAADSKQRSDSGKISTKETKSNTPAARPNENARKERLVCFEKYVKRPPIPVDNPAVRVSPKAINKL